MLQPKFTPWPWGVLAICAPGMAAVATVMQLIQNPVAAPQGDERFWEAAGAFFGVLGAGNGYLIAIAIGDFGRSVVALPLGAVTGYLSVQALRSPMVAGIVVAVYGIVIINAVINGVRILSGCTATMLLALLLMTITVGNVTGEMGHEQNLLMCYPLICSIITASMPLDRSVDGVFGAFLVGARASLHSMIAGLIGFAAVMLLFAIAGQFFWMGLGIERLLCSSVIGAMIANIFCIKSLFDVVYRVAPGMESAVQFEAPETQLPEKEEASAHAEGSSRTVEQPNQEESGAPLE